MTRTLALMLVPLLALGGCATMPILVGLPCNVGPVILDKGASTRLTRSEKEQIVTLNNSGAVLCKWKPPAKK